MQRRTPFADLVGVLCLGAALTVVGGCTAKVVEPSPGDATADVAALSGVEAAAPTDTVADTVTSSCSTAVNRMDPGAFDMSAWSMNCDAAPVIHIGDTVCGNTCDGVVPSPMTGICFDPPWRISLFVVDVPAGGSARVSVDSPSWITNWNSCAPSDMSSCGPTSLPVPAGQHRISVSRLGGCGPFMITAR